MGCDACQGGEERGSAVVFEQALGLGLAGDLAKSGTRTTDWPSTILTVLYRYTRVLYCTSTLYTTLLY